MKHSYILPFGSSMLLFLISFSLVNTGHSIVIGPPPTTYTGPSTLPPAPTLPPSTLPTAPTLPTPSTIPVTKAPYTAPPTTTAAGDLETMRYIASQVNSVLPSWLPMGDPCLSRTWQGVACNVQGRITTIQLSGVPLGVPIETFANFSTLPYLTYLDLSNTQITGSLPDQWSVLSTLKELMLNGNIGLTGLWPSSWNLVTMPNIGNYSTIGTNVQDSWGYFCVPLPSEIGYYYSTACTGSGATHGAKGNVVSGVHALCTTTPIMPGYYVSSLCQPGTFIQPGSDRIVSACTSPTSSQFTIQTCISGDTNDIGVNSKVQQCSIPQTMDGTFVQACVSGTYSTLGSDATQVPCTQPVAGQQYVTKQCFSGNLAYGVYGTDTVMTTCSMSQIPTGQYVEAVCNPGSPDALGSDRVLASCTVPGNGQYVYSACITGSNLQLGSNSVVKSCTVPVSGFYISSLCVVGSLSSPGSDSTLAPCGTISAGSIVHQPCVPGSYNILGTPTIVQSLSSATSSTGKTIAIAVGVSAAVLVLIAIMMVLRKTTPDGRRSFFESISHSVKPSKPVVPAPVVAVVAQVEEQANLEEASPIPEIPVIREQSAADARRHRRQLSRLNSENSLRSEV